MTNNIKRRLTEHNAGHSTHTNKYKPWTLRLCVSFDNRKHAEAFERYLKSHSGRAFLKKHLGAIPSDPLTSTDAISIKQNVTLKSEIASEASLLASGCTLHCCDHGSPYVLPSEREAIMNTLGTDVFVAEGNHFVIGKKFDGSDRNLDTDPCPFLQPDDRCALQVHDPELKPLDCYMHPVFPAYEDSQQNLCINPCCSACDYLSNQFIILAKRLIELVPTEHRIGLAGHQETHGFPLQPLNNGSGISDKLP